MMNFFIIEGPESPSSSDNSDNDGSNYDARSKLDVGRMMRHISRELDFNMRLKHTSPYSGDLYFRREDQFTEWREWYIENFPNTNPELKVKQAGDDVDFRALMMAFPAPTYALLCFLESCMEVDKAICGLDEDALASVKQWYPPQEMRAYKYIMSDKLLSWWKKELCELNDEINSSLTNLISVEIRVRDIVRETTRPTCIVEPNSNQSFFIEERFCGQLDERDVDYPTGLMDCIYARKNLLEYSTEILSASLERRKRREEDAVLAPTVPPHNQKGEGVSIIILLLRPGQPLIVLTGIRKRVPPALPAEVVERQTGNADTHSVVQGEGEQKET
jgi:hypothetical protein